MMQFDEVQIQQKRVLGLLLNLVDMTRRSYLIEMSEHVYITEMTEHHVEQTTDVLVRSFLSLNSIWKKYNYSYQTVYPIIRSKLLPTIASGWSFVLVKNDRVIGCGLGCDLLDYLQTPSMPTKLELFSKLGKAGKELERQLDFTGLKRGDACYGPYAVIDPKEASQGYSLKFWWECFAYGKVAGWKYYYSRISSPVSLKMLLKLGAEILAEASVEGEENEKIWMIRIDLRKPFPTYTMVEAMTQKKPAEKASL